MPRRLLPGIGSSDLKRPWGFQAAHGKADGNSSSGAWEGRVGAGRESSCWAGSEGQL